MEGYRSEGDVVTITMAEELTAKGFKFNQVNDFIVNTSTPLYVLYEVPAGLDLTVELIKRLWQTDSDGADLLVLWDYDVSTATKTPLTTFNENNDFRGVRDSSMQVSVLNPVSLDSATGVMTVTGAATIVDEGIIREPSSIIASGVGSNKSGDVDPTVGFRRYMPGTGFLFKVTSHGNTNKVTEGYTWMETPH